MPDELSKALKGLVKWGLSSRALAEHLDVAKPLLNVLPPSVDTMEAATVGRLMSEAVAAALDNMDPDIGLGMRTLYGLTPSYEVVPSRIRRRDAGQRLLKERWQSAEAFTRRHEIKYHALVADQLRRSFSASRADSRDEAEVAPQDTGAKDTYLRRSPVAELEDGFRLLSGQARLYYLRAGFPMQSYYLDPALGTEDNLMKRPDILSSRNLGGARKLATIPGPAHALYTALLDFGLLDLAIMKVLIKNKLTFDARHTSAYADSVFHQELTDEPYATWADDVRVLRSAVTHDWRASLSAVVPVRLRLVLHDAIFSWRNNVEEHLVGDGYIPNKEDVQSFIQALAVVPDGQLLWDHWLDWYATTHARCDGGYLFATSAPSYRCPVHLHIDEMRSQTETLDARAARFFLNLREWGVQYVQT